MKQQRLDGLADGIFAIVMTILIFELKVPSVSNPLDAQQLFSAMGGLIPVMLSLILSFGLLFTYWRAHHFLTSVYARTLTVALANYNALFFLFIVMVPFSAHLLGQYSHNVAAITVYGFNVVAIGLALLLMRFYIERNSSVETSPITPTDRRSGYIRIIFPMVSALIAIIFSFWNTNISLILFTVAILFNILPASTNFLHKWIEWIFAPVVDADDLSKKNPRSPYFRVHGFGLLGRVIDICRADIAGTAGKYVFDGPAGRNFFEFKGIDPQAFRDFVATGVSDDEIGKWVIEHGYTKSEEEIKHWSDGLEGGFGAVVSEDDAHGLTTQKTKKTFAKKRKIA